jgi:hypothetical protein
MSAAFDHGFDFTRKPSRFKRELFNSLDLGDFRWLAKGLWPQVGVCFLGGPSGSGKSFLSLQWATQICRGLPVLGFKSKQAGVVYIGAEDAGGIRLRMVGLRQESGTLEGDHLELIGQAPDLTDEDDVADLREVLEQSQAEMAERGIRLGLVVIDTMSAATPGADENTAKDVGPVLKALQDLASDLRLLVLMVAHTGHTEGHRLRGWSGLRANADGLIMLDERQSGAPGKITVVKAKNGQDGQTFGYELRPITLGFDEDGDLITTCVIEERDPPAESRSGRKPTKAEATGKMVMTAFGRVLEDRACTIHAPGANGVKGVKIDDLRAMAYQIGVGPADPEVPADADDAEKRRLTRKWHDQRKTDFKRGLDFLLQNQTLRTERGFLWEPGAKGGTE